MRNKVLPRKYQKETLATVGMKGKARKEIIRISVIKSVVKSLVDPEVVTKWVLRTTIRQGPAPAEINNGAGLETTTVHQTVDLGTINDAQVRFWIEGGENEGTVGYDTSVIEGPNAWATISTSSTCHK